jgi:hypothetical protein
MRRQRTTAPRESTVRIAITHAEPALDAGVSSDVPKRPGSQIQQYPARVSSPKTHQGSKRSSSSAMLTL